MSLAITTNTALSLTDGAFSKRQTNSNDFQTVFTQISPIAQTWSHDNQIIYVASSKAIHSFTPGKEDFTTVYQATKGSPLQPTLVSRDKSSIIFAQGSNIQLLNVGITPAKVSGSLIGHSTPITSLSLSHDSTLLASSSASGTLCVHNLAHNSLTVLKGFSSGTSSKNIICSFHPHTRTRLLIGSGKTLTVYDVSRPTAPIKSIQLAERDSSGVIPSLGHVVAISCSPFSKGLTAVAFNSGSLALVDLEKERSLLKVLQLKVPIACMTFSTDGAFIILGTENGKIIIKEWKSSASDHRTLSIGAAKGERIMDLAIHRRINKTPSAGSSPTATKITTTSLKPAPLGQQNPNQASPLPRPLPRPSPDPTAKARIATPLKRTSSDTRVKRTFSPPKASTSDDEGDISVQMDTLIGHKNEYKNENHPTEQRIPSAKVRSASTTSSSTVSGMKARLSPTISSQRTAKSPISSKTTTKTTISKVTSPKSRKSSSPISPTRQPASATSTQQVPSSHLAEGSRKKSVPSTTVPHRNESRNTTPALSLSRLPTPDLPSMDNPTPLWPRKPAQARPGISTPDLDRWFEAGQTKESRVKDGGAKRVGFAALDDAQEPNTPNTAASQSTESHNISERENKDSVEEGSSMTPSISISPMRRSQVYPDSLQISPRRPTSAADSIPTSGVEVWMRTLMSDMVYDYRHEMKEDIKGLHLDLLRLGRNWKNELRLLMDEYVGDLRELREENTRLRKENERLRGL
ncbi:hypothetical protein M422DRAFT_252391 [Sphaerobolus stellatus SS14]|uniref:WD40 repeat-like protein n=1 Tax=Sphaerobolus stellatus (strain SS14) TaxID=990650 RepID=A0A0C9UN29_SPHS4|nr:hypothetical protein M422DRAFT_252391 [Sphaerobolus stellatus SS14]